MSRFSADSSPKSVLPRVQTLARRAKAVPPETPFATVCELLRTSPYQLLAVVDTPGEVSALLTGPLLGVISAKSIADELLTAPPEEQEWLRKHGVARDVCTPVLPDECAVPTDTAAEVSRLFDRIGRDSAPVLESHERPLYLGMVARTDLLRDLHRPFVPPQIGGMATPLGVYLTTGNVSGGVGTLALAATGFLTFALHTTGLALLFAANHALERYVPAVARFTALLPRPLADSLPETVFTVALTALFLLLLRQTPLAGYHAAEHQVVHAIERGEPLLPEAVRRMPRVHPRCSTNLVAGLLLFYIIGTAFAGSLGAELSYLVGAFAAFLWWRPVGSFLQQHATTRPASDKEIESGIRAARDLFDALDSPVSSAVSKPVSPLQAKVRRIWQAGFVQIFMGSGIAFALLAFIAFVFPPFQQFFKSVFGE
ncbi:MAG: DUF1385 domain-containing protein [Akkermansiaceae bacterium]|nr:DUF1385 domain-containing protein [Armatimonadota bacterium]